MYALYLQLHLAVLVGVLLEGVTDVERLLGLDILSLLALTESNAVEHFVREVIDKFELDMLLTATHHLARTIIAHIAGAEKGLGIFGTVRREFLQVVEELAGYLMETDLGIYLYDRVGLFGKDILRDKLLEAFCKRLDILDLEREATINLF